MFDEMSDEAVAAAIGERSRAENIACAGRLAAIAELFERRWRASEPERRHWRIDPFDAVAAEVAAAQCITTAAAGAQLQVAICLAQRLPEVAALFATGALSYRVVQLIVSRTALAVDTAVLNGIDADLAAGLRSWGPLSRAKTEQAVDAIVAHHDPDARRRTETALRSRFLDVKHLGASATITGDLHAVDATVLDRRLSALANSVCAADPRTVDQRRADALGALAAGHTRLGCACGQDDCPAADGGEQPAAVLIHLLADHSAVDSGSDIVVHGEPDPTGREVITDTERLVEIIRTAPDPDSGPGPGPDPAPSPRARPANPALIVGGPVIPAEVIADLIRRGLAQLRPVVHPGDAPAESGYRPSRALADFVRCRDLSCRFPGCDRPARYCDIDHTIAYHAGGLTHASNLKLLCRPHHLLKTFWVGDPGWRDRQLPDGTVQWTTPSGQTYWTRPGSSVLFPVLATPTATLPPPPPQTPPAGTTNRGAMMPRRDRTRDQQHRYQITTERHHNNQARTHKPPPAPPPPPPPPDDDEEPPF